MKDDQKPLETEKYRRKDINYSDPEVAFDLPMLQKNRFKQILKMDIFENIKLLEETSDETIDNYSAIISLEDLKQEEQDGIQTAIGDLTEIMSQYSKLNPGERMKNIKDFLIKDFSSETKEFVSAYSYFLFSLQSLSRSRVPRVAMNENSLRLDEIYIQTNNEKLNQKICSNIEEKYYETLGLNEQFEKEKKEFKFNVSRLSFPFFKKLESLNLIDFTYKNKRTNPSLIFFSLNNQTTNYHNGFKIGITDNKQHIRDFKEFVAIEYDKFKTKNPDIINKAEIFSRMSKEMAPYFSYFDLSDEKPEFIEGYLLGVLSNELTSDNFYFPDFEIGNEAVRIRNSEIKIPQNEMYQNTVQCIKDIHEDFLNDSKKINDDANSMYL